MNPTIPDIVTRLSGNVDVYREMTGPTSFGSGFGATAGNGSGNLVGIDAGGFGLLLNVPAGYVSGNVLSSSATWNNATFASPGVTPGTYVCWGARRRLDSFSARFCFIRIGCFATQIELLSPISLES
jgi:hypothetical protein